MLIISVRDNENKRLKRNQKKWKIKKKNKDIKEHRGGGRSRRLKGGELNDFVMHLS